MPSSYASQHSASYPTPATDADRLRVEEQGRRWRILNEVWLEDALDRESAFFDIQLRASMPEPELSRNPALMVFQQIATLYDDPPEVEAEGTQPEALEALDLHLLWAQSQERALYVEGVNECLMRADWLDDDSDGEGRISYRVVPPHMVLCARTDHEDSSRLIYVEELRWMEVEAVEPTISEDGSTQTEGRVAYTGWVIETWDLTNPASPTLRRTYKDAQGTVAGEDAQPWPEVYTDADGPIMPYVIYHRTVSDKTWNPYPGRGVFWGTLTTACLWTFWLFGFRDASYDQRALIDGTVQGIAPQTDAARSAQGVTTDPRVVLQIKSDGERAAQLASWSKTVDLKASGEAVEQFMAGLAMYAGISPSDITLGSSARSGYAIVVSRHGQRRARKRQMVPARIGDRSLLITAARLLNRNAGTTLPTTRRAWSITYAPVEESPAELKARTEEVVTRLNAGLLSPVDAYRELNPGVSEAMALDALADIARSRALLAAAATPADQIATINALQALGDTLPRRSFYYNLQRMGLLHPEEDIAALSAEPPEMEEESAAEEVMDSATEAAALLDALEGADETTRPEILADLRETLADLLEALGGTLPSSPSTEGSTAMDEGEE